MNLNETQIAQPFFGTRKMMIETRVICNSTGVHHRWRPQSSSLPCIWHIFSCSLRRQITSETFNCSFRRSCSLVEGKSELTMQNMSCIRNTQVYNSHSAKEFHIDSEIVGRNNKLLIDCSQDSVAGGIVALGKFDALHIGHRELAIQASKIGNPFLLSFVRIGEVLGWEPRAPIVAKCDRKRVLSSWASYCGDVIPEEYQVEFSTVRHLSPREFVERLSRELRINGVVAGKNYRFGYKASGDSSELVRLCTDYGLVANIVSAVMDERQSSSCNGVSTNCPVEREMVSSTRIRQALGMGDIGCVTKLLGRKHRLVLVLNGECIFADRKITLPKSSMLNLPPKDGVYDDCNLVVEEEFVCPCKVTFDQDTIYLECDGSIPLLQLDDHSHNKQLIAIEFGCSR